MCVDCYCLQKGWVGGAEKREVNFARDAKTLSKIKLLKQVSSMKEWKRSALTTTKPILL